MIPSTIPTAMLMIAASVIHFMFKNLISLILQPWLMMVYLI